MNFDGRVFSAPPVGGSREPTKPSVQMDCEVCDGLVWVQRQNVEDAKRCLLLCDPCDQRLFNLQTHRLN